jgi:hypothetical protein
MKSHSTGVLNLRSASVFYEDYIILLYSIALSDEEILQPTLNIHLQP